MSIVKSIYFMVPEENEIRKDYPHISRELALQAFESTKAKGYPVVEVPVPRSVLTDAAKMKAYVHAAKAAMSMREAEPNSNEALLCASIMNEAYQMVLGNKLPGFLASSEGMVEIEKTLRQLLSPQKGWYRRPLSHNAENHGGANNWQTREPAKIKVPNKPKLEIKPSYNLSDFQRRHITSVLGGIGFDVSFKGVKDES